MYKPAKPAPTITASKVLMRLFFSSLISFIEVVIEISPVLCFTARPLDLACARASHR